MDAAIVVFNISNVESFQDAKSYVKILEEYGIVDTFLACHKLTQN